jgi:peptide/nickel transport system ATP-binding protein
MLETVGMTPPQDYAKRYPHQLSGGEKQRVALIRALLMNPDLIMADEAVSALDVSLRIEMMEIMLDLQDRFNTSFIFIAHDLANARYLAERAGGRIGVMYLGELVEIGTVSQIKNNPKHPYTKTLNWATPSLNPDRADGEMPLRAIDIPDPTNPPSGCRFHTRCPKAREICTEKTPEFTSTENDNHPAKCFRQFEDHEYWNSEPLPGADTNEDEAINP